MPPVDTYLTIQQGTGMRHPKKTSNVIVIMTQKEINPKTKKYSQRWDCLVLSLK